MDKLAFLQRMKKLHPDDPEAVYWLAQELAARGRWVEAIGQYSAGLALGPGEEIRAALLAGLTEASAKLQQGAAEPADAPAELAAREAEEAEEAEEADGVAAAQDEDTAADDDAEAEDDAVEDDDDADDDDVADDDVEYDDDDADDDDAADDGEEARREQAAALVQQAGGGPEVGRTSDEIVFARSTIGLHVMDGGKASGMRASAPAKVTFDDVAGLKELKKTIQLRIISPFQNQGLFSKFRKKAGGGVLMYGPPGCGKTYIARATAGECRASFIPVHITDILNKYIGESERNLKDMFDKARGQKPSIMFFDEVDTIGFNRSHSSSSMRGVIDTFLTEMEGIDTSTDQVLIIGATNMPWDVDDALKRPGRFDRLVFVAPPDEDAREHLFRLKLSGRYADSIDTRSLARRTEFFSGADIDNLCERAAERVLGEILETGVERPIRMEDFEALLQEVRPSTLEWLRKAKNFVKYANQSGIYNDVEDYLRRFGRQI